MKWSDVVEFNTEPRRHVGGILFECKECVKMRKWTLTPWLVAKRVLYNSTHNRLQTSVNVATLSLHLLHHSILYYDAVNYYRQNDVSITAFQVGYDDTDASYSAKIVTLWNNFTVELCSYVVSSLLLMLEVVFEVTAETKFTELSIALCSVYLSVQWTYDFISVLFLSSFGLVTYLWIPYYTEKSLRWKFT